MYEFNKIPPSARRARFWTAFWNQSGIGFGDFCNRRRTRLCRRSLFALPVVGEIADLIVTGLPYRITKSKVTVVINAIEFIPFIGDFVPTYTISTLLWILNESRKKQAGHKGESHRLELTITWILHPTTGVKTSRQGSWEPTRLFLFGIHLTIILCTIS